ncbi:hypothetical protein HYS31_03065 [Candidatus Woesearchaeota archaeon]|nr:hypothetical protein [Candidatus Woesearchaeota archaeon]
MRIALCQLNPTVGDIKGNTKKIISIIKSTKADLIVFPELSITGYSPQDLLLNPNFVEENLKAFERIVQSTKNKAAIIGFIDKRNNQLYNSAAVMQDTQILRIHHKICLPNYSIFDEKRWFMEGSEATIFEFNGKKIGLSICEDIWFPETTKKQKDNGAELIINISASPYGEGKIKKIEKILKERWEENRIPIAYVNQAGGQDGIVYYGHSMFFNNGRIVRKAKDFEENSLIVETQ